jgi:hypothetical protein
MATKYLSYNTVSSVFSAVDLPSTTQVYSNQISLTNVSVSQTQIVNVGETAPTFLNIFPQVMKAVPGDNDVVVTVETFDNLNNITTSTSYVEASGGVMKLKSEFNYSMATEVANIDGYQVVRSGAINHNNFKSVATATPYV